MNINLAYSVILFYFFFFQAEDGIRDKLVTGVQTFFFFQAEDGIRDKLVTGVRRVLFRSTRDTIPSHLIAARDVPGDVARFYAHLCPAGVYEATENGLRINAPNCVDCKATDVLGPRWTQIGRAHV